MSTTCCSQIPTRWRQELCCSQSTIVTGPVCDPTVTRYLPFGHGHGSDFQAVGTIKVDSAFPDTSAGGTQYCPDLMAESPAAVGEAAVGSLWPATAGEATCSAGSGLTWVYGGKPSGGEYGS